jgi:hypothetical protein
MGEVRNMQKREALFYRFSCQCYPFLLLYSSGNKRRKRLKRCLPNQYASAADLVAVSPHDLRHYLPFAL